MRAQQRTNGAGPDTPAAVGVFDPTREKVFAIMSRELTVARREMTLSSAIEALVDQDISHLPVVDDDRHVVGMLSKTDVVRDRLFAGDSDESDVRLPAKKGVTYAPHGFHEEGEQKTTVGDVMSTRVLCVRDDATVGEAAQLMVAHRIHGLPVVSKDNTLVGFVSSLDLAAWVARGKNY